jgi:cyclase
VADAVSIPVIASGGAGSIKDFGKAINDCNASAVAAGSYFVFQGKHRAVLITYPSKIEIKDALLG